MLIFLTLWLLRQVWVNELGLKYKVLPEMGQKTGASLSLALDISPRTPVSL